MFLNASDAGVEQVIVNPWWALLIVLGLLLAFKAIASMDIDE